MTLKPPANRPVAHDLAFALVDFSATPLLLLDEDLNVVAASASFCETFHLDAAGAVGCRISELGSGDWNVPRLLSQLKAAASGLAEITNYEFNIAPKGRVTRTLILHARRLQYAGERETLLGLSACDVTDARITEQLKEDLKLEKEVLRREHSDRVANSLRTIASVLAQTARNVRSQEARTQLLDTHQKVISVAALQKHDPASWLRGGELESASHAGRTYMMIGHGTAASSGVEAALRQELEEQKQALAGARADRQKALDALESRAAFLTTTSHELRTPLTAVLGFSEILMEEIFGPIANDRYREYAEIIHNSGAHLLNLVNDLLDISKLDIGKLELHFARVEILKVIIDCVRGVETQANKSHVGISVNVYDGVRYMRGDDKRLHQILLNLLSNAIKFTRDGGEIRVCAFRRGELIAISVSDTGIGISANDMPKVFEAFGQIDSPLGRKHEGSGLGLPLTKALTELHGGSLAIDSAEGIGTTVTVLFPSGAEEVEWMAEPKLRPPSWQTRSQVRTA
jgi:signal transduction histidine kinase